MKSFRNKSGRIDTPSTDRLKYILSVISIALTTALVVILETALHR